MISKPARWRRAGVAALATVSLALTALAAQVSPPNVHAVDEPAQKGEKGGDAGGEKKPAHVAIKLPAATLDRHVGTYRLNDGIFIVVRRDGEKMLARLTGQPEFEIQPERDNYFFWTVVDAQIEFSNDGTGSATLHQFGRDMPLTKVDAAAATQAQSELDARIAANTPAPGSEPALRHHLDSVAAGNIDYDHMEAGLESVMRKNEAQVKSVRAQLGAVKSVKFIGVGKMGWDAFDVEFEHGTLQYRVSVSPGGKLAGMMAMSVP